MDENNRQCDFDGYPIFYEGKKEMLQVAIKMAEKSMSTEKEREPIGSMCLEFADGHDNALNNLITKLKEYDITQ